MYKSMLEVYPLRF